MSAKGYRHSHCRNGHEFTPETTYVYPDGRRECRACQRNRARRYQRVSRKERNEYQRIWKEAERRRRGVKALDNNRWKNRKTPGPESRLPAEPFAEWLRQRMPGELRHSSLAFLNDYRPPNFRDWTQSMGMDDSQARKLISGESKKVHLDVVDRALVAAGEPWMLQELYPVEEEAV